MPRKKKRSDWNIWYVEKHFEYTNSLLERTEKRANFLIVANSILTVLYFSLYEFVSNYSVKNTKELPNEHPLTLNLAIVIIPEVIFIISTVFSVLSVLPVIFDHKIAINQERIAKGSLDSYKNFIKTRELDRMIEDYIDETYVLTKILAYRGKWVSRAAKLFFLGIIVTTIVFLFLFILKNK